MLQCYLLVNKHCSNSNLNNGDGEAIGVGFWGVFFSFLLKLTIKKPLEMLLEHSHQVCQMPNIWSPFGLSAQNIVFSV